MGRNELNRMQREGKGGHKVGNREWIYTEKSHIIHDDIWRVCAKAGREGSTREGNSRSVLR